MKRNSPGKRVLCFAAAVLMAVACVLSSWAGCVTSTYTASGECDLYISSSGGWILYKIGSASLKRTTTGVQINPPVGTVVELEAVDDAKREFLYWKDEYAGRIFSQEHKLRLVVGPNIHLKAMFARISDTTVHSVSVVNYGGSLLYDNKEVRINNGTFTLPDTAGKVPGFTFTGWSATADQIRAATAPLIVYPKYTVNDETYTVDITNNRYVSGAGRYTNFQTVNLKAEPKNGSGETFSYWQNADGDIVSYERDYSFRINYDTELTAVYGETVTPEPIIRTSAICRDPDDMKITFYAERSIPESYTVLTHGILISTAPNVTELQMVISKAKLESDSTAVVRKCAGNSNENCGTFSLAKGDIANSVVVSARPFAVTQDEAGNMFVTYGDMVQASNQEAIQ